MRRERLDDMEAFKLQRDLDDAAGHEPSDLRFEVEPVVAGGQVRYFARLKAGPVMSPYREHPSQARTDGAHLVNTVHVN